MLARTGRPEQARALLKGDDPALAKLDLNRPQPGILSTPPPPGFAELLLGLAVSLSRGEDRALPLTLVQVARHAAPANSEAAILAALLLARRDREAEALAALDSVPTNDPFNEDVLDASARLLLQMNRGPEALTRATAAATAKSASAGDHARLGNILDDLGRHAEAADAYGRAAALAEAARAGNRWSYRLLRAAATRRDRPLARSPRRASRRPRHRARGAAFAQLSRLRLARTRRESRRGRGDDPPRARASPRRSSITDSLGWALYKRGRLPEAIETLRTAAAAQPAEAEIHEHLGDALFRAGRRYEARFAWRAALVNAETGRGQAHRGQIARRLDRRHRGSMIELDLRLAEPAPAKLNLALHVRGKLPDGRHALETLFAFCIDGDLLRAELADEIASTSAAQWPPTSPLTDDNIVLKAAHALAKAANCTKGAHLSSTSACPSPRASAAARPTPPPRCAC